MGGFHSTSWSFHEEERILPPDRLQTWTEHPLFPRYPVCTLLCHWICFDSWWPYERVKSTLSCAQQPSSASIDSCLRIFFFMNSFHLMLSLPLFLLLSIFTVLLCSLPPTKNPAFLWCTQSRKASVLSPLSPSMFQAFFYSSFWWSRVSIELSSNIILQMNHFSPNQPSLSNFSIHT